MDDVTDDPALEANAPDAEVEDTRPRVRTAADLPDGPARRIFTATDTLSDIFQFALERAMSPEVILERIIAKVITHTGPHVVIPAYVKKPASLNLGVMAISESGGGKSSSAELVADDVLVIPDHGTAQTSLKIPPRVREGLPIGTGAGLEETFDQRPYQEYLDARHAYEQARDAAVRASGDPDAQPASLKEPREVPLPEDRAGFDSDEVSKFQAAARRPDSDLILTLLSGLMGNKMGVTNKAENARSIPSHGYRMSLIINAQPALTGWILDQTDNGFAQRWVWAPAAPRYVHADVRTEKPDYAALRGQRGVVRKRTTSTLTIRVPAAALERRELPEGVKSWGAEAADDARINMTFGAAAVAQVEYEATQVNRDRMKSHRNLTQMKVACGLALMHGRTDVSDEDWDIATDIMEISDEVMAECAEAAAEAIQAEYNREADHRERGKAAAEVARTDRKAKAMRLLGEVANGGGGYDHKLSGAAYRSARRFRTELDAMIADLEKSGQAIVVTEGSTRYIYTPDTAPESVTGPTTKMVTFNPFTGQGAAEPAEQETGDSGVDAAPEQVSTASAVAIPDPPPPAWTPASREEYDAAVAAYEPPDVCAVPADRTALREQAIALAREALGEAEP
jgi:hypothetical protein